MLVTRMLTIPVLEIKPNFFYRNNNHLGAHEGQRPPEGQGQSSSQDLKNVEAMLETFIQSQQRQFEHQKRQDEVIKALATRVDLLTTHNNMLETRIADK